ncbi:hypothetical protein [Kocuria sabuli]|uniref:hypothetical protein n=1 Tax=Kocuria sabuli TaxID=3071448 RepID=UPI0034D52956
MSEPVRISIPAHIAEPSPELRQVIDALTGRAEEHAAPVLRQALDAALPNLPGILHMLDKATAIRAAEFTRRIKDSMAVQQVVVELTRRAETEPEAAEAIDEGVRILDANPEAAFVMAGPAAETAERIGVGRSIAAGALIAGSLYLSGAGAYADDQRLDQAEQISITQDVFDIAAGYVLGSSSSSTSQAPQKTPPQGKRSRREE